jgi:septal ring factor EnvC (AmiA/AmiB activator)
MSRKDELREQISFVDKAIQELKKQRDQLAEQEQPTEEVSRDIDHQIIKLMNLSLQYSKF